LFPERALAALSSDEVVCGSQRVACDPAYGREPWQGALAALRSLRFKEPTRVTVTLSSAFVRYALVPRSDALAGEAEEQAYVRHHFARVHGERAKGWVFRWSEGLACAIDRRLFDELRASFPASGKARLVSVQPALMQAINRWRNEFPATGAWLVLAEHERACAALHDGHGWRSVHSAKGDWRDVLERERHRAPVVVPQLVLLAGAAAPAGDAAPGAGWQYRELAA
jgi:hypothetical protein